MDPKVPSPQAESTGEAAEVSPSAVAPGTSAEQQPVLAPQPAATSRPSARTASNAPPPSSSPSPSVPAAPATKPAEVPPGRGHAAAGTSYEVWLETTGGYAPGASASVIAVVNAKSPYKCNTQYPYKFVLDAPPSGVSYPSTTVRGMRVEGKRASMPIPFVPTSAGSHTIGGTLSFSTCTEDKCLVDKAHLSVVVDVR
jgi:hypothetical protein